jgi:hypothetical protein
MLLTMQPPLAASDLGSEWLSGNLCSSSSTMGHLKQKNKIFLSVDFVMPFHLHSFYTWSQSYDFGIYAE